MKRNGWQRFWDWYFNGEVKSGSFAASLFWWEERRIGYMLVCLGFLVCWFCLGFANVEVRQDLLHQAVLPAFYLLEFLNVGYCLGVVFDNLIRLGVPVVTRDQVRRDLLKMGFWGTVIVFTLVTVFLFLQMLAQ